MIIIGIRLLIINISVSCSRVDELVHAHQLIRYLTDMTTSMLMSLYTKQNDFNDNA